MLHRAFEVRGHHPHRNSAIVLVSAVTSHPGDVDRARRVQRSQHPVGV